MPTKTDTKKNKAIDNELDKMIHEQKEREKERIRENKKKEKQLTQLEYLWANINPLQYLIAQKPELLKDMSIEDITKIATMLGEKKEVDIKSKLEKRIEFLEAVVILIIKNMI